ILVEKAKKYFNQGDSQACLEDLDDAFRIAPSVSVRILRLQLYLVLVHVDDALGLLVELLKEHPLYASFIFVSLEDFPNLEQKEMYFERLAGLKEYYLALEDKELFSSPSIVLSQIRLLKNDKRSNEAYTMLSNWM